MKTLKPIALAIALGFCSVHAFAFDAEFDSNTPDINTFSIGYRMGFLNKYSIKGFPRSGEGDLQMGKNSSEARVEIPCAKEGETNCTKVINPWYFSANQNEGDVSDRLNAEQGHNVIIKYRQVIANGVGFVRAYETDYRAIDITRVDQGIEPKPCDDGGGWGLKSDGSISGRLVKLSRKGNTPVTKGYEAIIQKGDGGDQFKEMSVYDEKMAACMYKWLLSGRRVKVTYNQAFINLTRPFHDTTYKIVRVDRADSDELLR